MPNGRNSIKGERKRKIVLQHVSQEPIYVILAVINKLRRSLATAHQTIEKRKDAAEHKIYVCPLCIMSNVRQTNKNRWKKRSKNNVDSVSGRKNCPKKLKKVFWILFYVEREFYKCNKIKIKKICLSIWQ